MKRLLTALIVTASLLASCATLPSPKQIQDLKAIAGIWTGTLYTRAIGNHAVTLTIKEDGTYLAVMPTLQPGTFSGTVRVVGGNAEWKSETTGRTGTYTLHEGDGHRILVSRAADGGSEGKYTPSARK